jgi:mannuronan 5-epimerase
LNTSVFASNSNPTSSESSPCISYDSREQIISVTCKTSTLTDIYIEINDTDILNKETADGVWSLNAGIVIEHDAELVIDEEDTKWLKVLSPHTGSDTDSGGGSDENANGEEEEEEENGTVHAIRVHGGLNIDSIKITSWDPAINGYNKV